MAGGVGAGVAAVDPGGDGNRRLILQGVGLAGEDSPVVGAADVGDVGQVGNRRVAGGADGAGIEVVAVVAGEGIGIRRIARRGRSRVVVVTLVAADAGRGTPGRGVGPGAVAGGGGAGAGGATRVSDGGGEVDGGIAVGAGAAGITVAIVTVTGDTFTVVAVGVDTVSGMGPAGRRQGAVGMAGPAGERAAPPDRS